MANQFSVVRVFDQASLAHVAQAKLKSLGIESFIQDENIVSLNWLYSNAVGGVKLMVETSDLLAARRALECDEAADTESDEGEDPSRPDSEAAREAPRRFREMKGVLCPECGSDEVRYQKFSERWAFIPMLPIVLGFPLPWPLRRWLCRRCGHTWKAERK